MSPVTNQDVEHEINLLKHIREFNLSWITRCKLLTDNPKICDIAISYLNSLDKKNVDLGFNLFALISNTYYRENFHSDILNAFLQSGSHGSGNSYLHLFIEYLNSLGARLKLSDYTDTVSLREKGKIDILIYDKISGKAIIIENKINNAPDMPRQIPRYVQYVKERNLTCDCIAYLSLNKDKLPSTLNWESSEIDFIKSKIVYSLAYNNSDKDLYNGWIAKAEKITNNIDAFLVLRQYGALIKKLGGNIMNKVIVEKFYQEMLNPESYKTALSVKSMLSDLILFRAEKINDFFKSNLQPFQSIIVWQSYVVALHEYFIDGHNWSVDIGVYEDEYRLEFWDRNGKDAQEATQLLQRMNVLDDSYYENNGRMKKRFKFPEQENEMLEYVVMFKNKLAEATKNP